METLSGFPYGRLQVGRDGAVAAGSLEAVAGAAAGRTDVIWLAHGFRNNEAEATGWYAEFLQNLRANLDRPEFAGSQRGRTYAVVGVYWPSKAFAEGPERDAGSVQGLEDDEAAQIGKLRQKLEDMQRTEARPEQQRQLDEAMALLPELADDTAKQDEFVALVLSLLDGSELEADATEGVARVRTRAGSEILDSLRTPLLEREDDGSEGGIAAVQPLTGLGAGAAGEDAEGTALGFGTFFGNVFGRVGQFLNMTTWWLMKERAGVVGLKGVAAAVRDLRQRQPGVRIHLVGHSLGGRVMAGCVKALGEPPALQPDSVVLLQAAFSHYGFSPGQERRRPAGFFRAVLARQLVRGPLVATYSAEDSVVGKAYALASRLAGDNVLGIGGKDDQFGGIGRNGSQETVESAQDQLHRPGEPYVDLRPGIVLNLDGSGGLIRDHGDIRNPAVTYAVAAAISAT